MARKKRARARPASPAPHPKQEAKPATNVLLDWRFNLAVLVCMEVLLVLFFFDRELVRYHQRVARRMLLSAQTRNDYEKAYREYLWLLQRDPSSAAFIQALGDAALGLGRFDEAEKLYGQATNSRYDRPGIKLSLALSYYGRAMKAGDPALKQKYAQYSLRLMDMAYREDPLSLKVNYWKGMFARRRGDLVEAAKFFSRVRADLLPLGRPPNIEEKRLIEDAKTQLENIKTLVLGDKDYSLDVADLKIAPPEPVVPPGGLQPAATPTSPAMPLSPTSNPTTAPR